ncbi:MAG: hypothetical protein ACTSUY_12865, partial [Alphaproteobacteria bacterium]
FAALARLYERHYRREGDEAPKLHVTKLETGSILMEVAPYGLIMGGIAIMDGSVIVADFTNRIWRGIKSFSSPAGEAPRIEMPSNEDAKDIKEFAKPLLGKKGASLGIKHARYEKNDGEKRTVVEYTFDESELNRAAINIDRKLELQTVTFGGLEPPSEKFRNEVMLFLDQAKRGPGKEKGRTGDKGVIPDVSDKPLPVYFRNGINDLKEQMTREVNPLTSTFVVDVYVQYEEGEPKGYIVTEVHKTFENDENEDE